MRRSDADRRPAEAKPHPVAAPRPLIIERPDLQSRAQRFGYLSVTFLGWFLWLYLFVPLLSLVAWGLGATRVYQVMLQDLQPGELTLLLKVYGSGAGLLSAIYLLWAITSWWRFRNVERRRPRPAASDQALAASHHLSAAELAELRRARRLVVPQERLARMFGAPPPAPAGDQSRRASGSG